MKAILFDLGRVLIGYAHEKTLHGLASVCRADTELSTLLRALDDDLALGRAGIDELHAWLQTHADASPDRAAFADAFNAGLSRDDAALAYALELNTRPGVRVGVISNTNAAHVAWIDAHTPEVRSLAVALMSNEVGMAKPDPAIFHLALARVGVAARDALFVDDVQANADAARAVGMDALLHEDWAHTRPQIEAWLCKPEVI